MISSRSQMCRAFRLTIPGLAAGGEGRDGSREGAKALTCGGRRPYHWRMNLGRLVGNMRYGGSWLLLAMSFAGCEDAAKRPVRAQAPALEPQQIQQTQG